MSKDEGRTRRVRKLLSFNEAEWATVKRRMELAEATSFDAFARRVLLDGEVKVKTTAFDVSQLRVELSRIGNNVNQIARQVNTEDGITYEQMVATRTLLSQIQRLLERQGSREVES